MWGNAGFANQECKEVSYITEDGYKRYKTVCGATLLCDSKVEKYGIKFIFDFKNGTMIESRKDRNDWETNIVGSINSEIFTYGIYVGSGDMYSHIFYVMTSNLDNHFDIIVKTINSSCELNVFFNNLCSIIFSSATSINQLMKGIFFVR